MKPDTNSSPKETSPAQQIDAIIKEPGDWRGKRLSRLRACVKKADPTVVEQVEETQQPNGSPCVVPRWNNMHSGYAHPGTPLQGR